MYDRIRPHILFGMRWDRLNSPSSFLFELRETQPDPEVLPAGRGLWSDIPNCVFWFRVVTRLE